MDAFANLDPLGGKSSTSKTPAYPYPVQPQPQTYSQQPQQQQQQAYGMPPPQQQQQQVYGMPPPQQQQQQVYGMPPPPQQQQLQMNMGGLGLGMGGSINNYGAPVAPPSIPGMYVNQPQQQQQQQVPPPIMYDSIKNLLQKKPDIVAGASGNGADPFSCFTNKPSSRTNSGNLNLDTKPPPSNASYDPFSGGATPASTPTSFGSQSNATPTANLSIFGDVAPSTGHISSSSTTPKNSALADRLRGGKRQTQESQRASLAINSTAVSTSGGTSVSIKKQLGGNSAAPATSSSLAAVPTTSPDNLLGF